MAKASGGGGRPYSERGFKRVSARLDSAVSYYRSALNIGTPSLIARRKADLRAAMNAYQAYKDRKP